ncbi:MAG: hypothetical protein QNJ29_15160 [Rhizobiaceae bacterium]|nr:hypothetical protein [Rhizobiaceae bacterium]
MASGAQNKPKWRAGNAEAEARADALRSRFKKITDRSIPANSKQSVLKTFALLIGLALIGFSVAGFYDLHW